MKHFKKLLKFVKAVAEGPEWLDRVDLLRLSDRLTVVYIDLLINVMPFNLSTQNMYSRVLLQLGAPGVTRRHRGTVSRETHRKHLSAA